MEFLSANLSKYLVMKQVAAKFVPHYCLHLNKRAITAAVPCFKNQLKNVPIFFFFFDIHMEINFGAMTTTPKRSQNVTNGKLPLPHNPRKRSNNHLFLSHEGIAHPEFVLPGQMVYPGVLKRLRHDFWKKHPELWLTGYRSLVRPP